MSAGVPARYVTPPERSVFVVPSDAPPYCEVLAMSEAEAARVIVPGKTRYTLGSRALLRRKKHAAAVERRRPGGPYITCDANGKVRGIFGSWAGAAQDLVGLAQEFEKGRGS